MDIVVLNAQDIERSHCTNGFSVKNSTEAKVIQPYFLDRLVITFYTIPSISAGIRGDIPTKIGIGWVGAVGESLKEVEKQLLRLFIRGICSLEEKND